MGGDHRSKLTRERDWLLARLRAKHDLTLEQFRAGLSGRGVHVNVPGIWNYFARKKIRFKKSLLTSEQERPDVAMARDLWRSNQASLDIHRLVFLDETWGRTNMTRTHGRCPKGKRLHGEAPYCHWTTMTFVAGLRCDGVIAPMLRDCPMNGRIFAAPQPGYEPYRTVLLKDQDTATSRRCGYQ